MSKSQSRKASVVRAVRMTPEQDTLVCEAAENRGIGPATFCRNAILRASGQPVPASTRKRNIIAVEVAPILAALAAIGNNINQIAKASNRGGAPELAELSRSAAILGEIHQAVIALTSQLDR